MSCHKRLTAALSVAALVCALTATATATASSNTIPGASAAADDAVSIQGAVTVGGPWHFFLFGGVGSPVFNCGGCFGTNYDDAGDPPYTFTTTGPATLKVADGSLNGDRFEVFDFGVSLGQTTAVPAAGSCGGDPDACFADPAASHGSFALAPGPHSITIIVTASPFGAGGGWFRIDETSSCATVASAVGCWRFGEPIGPTAVDSSGLGNHGTYLGNPTLGVPGALFADPDTAVTLDGVDDIVRVPDSPSLDVGASLSAEGWIKRDSAAKTHQLMNKGNLGLQLVVMAAGAGGQVFLRKANVTTIARSVLAVPAGAYHHIVATVNGANSARIYIDGVENTVQVGTVQVIQDTAFPLFFGSGNTTPATYDEFVLYDGVLTQAEVDARYALGGP